MSIAAMSMCWGSGFPAEGAPELSAPAVRVVALAIADVVNDLNGNEFYGSLPRLGKKVGLHRDTVRRVVDHLVAAGVLAVVAEKPGKSTVYRWDWWGHPAESPQGADPAESPRGTPRDVPRPPRGTSRADTKRDPRTPQGAPDSTDEPETPPPAGEGGRIEGIIAAAVDARVQAATTAGGIKHPGAFRRSQEAELGTDDNRARVLLWLANFPGATDSLYGGCLADGTTAALRGYARPDLDADLYAMYDELETPPVAERPALRLVGPGGLG